MSNWVKTIGIVGLALMVLGCQQAAGSVVDPGDVMLDKLAAEYGAVPVLDQDFSYDAYTWEVQERLVIGRPVAFKAGVSDVFLRDGVMIVRFSTDWPSQIIWDLDCSPDVVAKILASDSDYRFLDKYAVVANITSVVKAIIEVGVIGGGEGEYQYIEFDYSLPDLLTAKGSCVDVAYIPRGN